MRTRFFSRMLLLVLVGLMAIHVPAKAYPAGGNSTSVTTTYSFNLGPYFQGELRATFRATPMSNGVWQVEATFRPRNLDVALLNWSGFFVGWAHVHGTATATVTMESGASSLIAASGLYYTNHNGLQIQPQVYCTFVVNAAGVVTPQTIGVF